MEDNNSKFIIVMESLISNLIRPFRFTYSLLDLGPKITQRYRRQDNTLLNDRGMKIHYSYYRNITKSYQKISLNQKDKQKTQINIHTDRNDHQSQKQIAKNSQSKSIESKTCLIYSHCNSGCRIQGMQFVQQAISKGWNVCLFDFTGSGLSEGEHISLGYYEAMDLQSIISEVISRGNTKINLWGRSMGASTIIQYLSETKQIQNISSCVLDSPFSSLWRVIKQFGKKKTKIPEFILEHVIEYIRSQIIKKYSFDIKSLQLSKKIIKIKNIPIMFIASTSDSFVDCEHTIELYRETSSHRKVLQYIEKQHNSPRENNIVTQGIEFMAKNLKYNEKNNVYNHKINGNLRKQHKDNGYLIGGIIRSKNGFQDSTPLLNGRNMAEIIINANQKDEKCPNKRLKNKSALGKKQNKSNVSLYRGGDTIEKKNEQIKKNLENRSMIVLGGTTEIQKQRNNVKKQVQKCIIKEQNSKGVNNFVGKQKNIQIDPINVNFEQKQHINNENPPNLQFSPTYHKLSQEGCIKRFHSFSFISNNPDQQRKKQKGQKKQNISCNHIERGQNNKFEHQKVIENHKNSAMNLKNQKNSVSSRNIIKLNPIPNNSHSNKCIKITSQILPQNNKLKMNSNENQRISFDEKSCKKLQIVSKEQFDKSWGHSLNKTMFEGRKQDGRKSVFERTLNKQNLSNTINYLGKNPLIKKVKPQKINQNVYMEEKSFLKVKEHQSIEQPLNQEKGQKKVLGNTLSVRTLRKSLKPKKMKTQNDQSVEKDEKLFRIFEDQNKITSMPISLEQSLQQDIQDNSPTKKVTFESNLINFNEKNPFSTLSDKKNLEKTQSLGKKKMKISLNRGKINEKRQELQMKPLRIQIPKYRQLQQINRVIKIQIDRNSICKKDDKQEKAKRLKNLSDMKMPMVLIDKHLGSFKNQIYEQSKMY